MPTIQIEHGLIRCPEIGEPGGVGCILLDGKVTHGDSSGDIQRVELVPKYRIYKKNSISKKCHYSYLHTSLYGWQPSLWTARLKLLFVMGTMSLCLREEDLATLAGKSTSATFKNQMSNINMKYIVYKPSNKSFSI